MDKLLIKLLRCYVLMAMITFVVFLPGVASGCWGPEARLASQASEASGQFVLVRVVNLYSEADPSHPRTYAELAVLHIGEASPVGELTLGWEEGPLTEGGWVRTSTAPRFDIGGFYLVHGHATDAAQLNSDSEVTFTLTEERMSVFEIVPQTSASNGELVVDGDALVLLERGHGVVYSADGVPQISKEKAVAGGPQGLDFGSLPTFAPCLTILLADFIILIANP